MLFNYNISLLIFCAMYIYFDSALLLVFKKTAHPFNGGMSLL